jgi:hypothetical protein
MCRCTDIMFFQNPPYMAARQLLIPWIAAVGTSFSPLPCQAWHGHGVTSAHRVEVEIGADGPASAPPSGAAAAAPPAGAEGLHMDGREGAGLVPWRMGPWGVVGVLTFD